MIRFRALASAVAVTAALAVPSAAVAKVTPGVYKGNLYRVTGAKIANAPGAVSVVGTKVTITAPRFPVMCRDARGVFRPQGTHAFVFKGVLKGNAVGGTFKDPYGEVAFYLVNGKFSADSFVGKLTFQGRCKGTASVRAVRSGGVVGVQGGS